MNRVQHLCTQINNQTPVPTKSDYEVNSFDKSQKGYYGIIHQKYYNIDPKLIQDIVVGNLNQPDSGAIVSKIAVFLAGFPGTICLTAINKLYSSGIEACAVIATKIRTGTLDIGISAGVEQMTMYDMQSSMNAELLSDAILIIHVQEITYLVWDRHQKICLLDMKSLVYNKGQSEGLFKDEIVPVKQQWREDKGSSCLQGDQIVYQQLGIEQ